MTNPFQFPNGQLAYSAEDLLELCQKFPDDGVHHLIREDLEKWLSYIGKEDIARCAASARQTSLDDRAKLEEFLNKCHALSSPASRDYSEAATNSTVETPIEESQPEPVSNPVEETTTPTAVEAPVADTKPESTPAIEPKTAKPSFFKVIARLIVNVLYRDKGRN